MNNVKSVFWEKVNFTLYRGTMIEPFWRYSLPSSIVWTCIYIVVLVWGLIGNTVVAVVIIKTKKCPTDYFLLNLAIADLLVLVCCLPATLLSNLIIRKFFVFHDMFRKLYLSIMCLKIFSA